MAKRNEVALMGEGETTVLEGEVLGPEEITEDFTVEAKHIADTDRKFDNLCNRIVAHGKEGRRLMAIGAASAVVMTVTNGSVKYIEQFLASVGEETRRNAFRRYFETVGPVLWDDKREVEQGDGSMKKAPGFVLHSKRQSEAARNRSKDKAKYDTGLMVKSPWQIAGPERSYVPFDLDKYLAAGVRIAKRQLDEAHIKRTKATAADLKKNNLAALSALEKLVESRKTHAGSEANN